MMAMQGRKVPMSKVYMDKQSGKYGRNIMSGGLLYILSVGRMRCNYEEV